MNLAYIGLGSNIEPRERYLEEAMKRLTTGERVKIVSTSSIYETAPVGYVEQSDFLNMVIKVETSFSSFELLRYCQQIEKDLGRERKLKNGPRTLDLDILLYNQESIRLEDLTIPHPRLHERAFVLVPFNEIAPEVTIPTIGLKVKEILSKIPTNELSEVVKWEANFD